jgi:alkanesulfonate monooxygenase SsuD/methylene tetrahydromethanopterin reductase-like flavin-dependent oxidoreductase (luciferase family)
MSGRPLHVAVEIGAGGDDVAAARAAEAAGFALVTLDDSPLPPAGGFRLEAGVRAAYLARRTSRIGLAPTLHVTVTEPFHVATQLASLDHASLGRAAWVVGAANSEAALATIGGRPLGEGELRREVADVVGAARQLWDSWEDDAVIRDAATGRFVDADRVHHVNFTGARFTVTGPLITPRPPQGQLVVLGADTLGVTARLDVALVAATTFDEVAARARQARSDGAPLVLAELEVVFGADRDPQAGPRLRAAGGADEFRALIERLGDVADGVRLHLARPAAQLSLVAAALGPRPPVGRTLRESLGLARPANQFANAR